MSDKEPRRRKKRKDLQSLRKDDTRSEDQIFTPAKPESKDSDQEVEEEVVVPTYQPSVFAKFVFVLLFSGLVVSMSIVFISLQGTDKGEVDIFDDHHSEEVQISHEDHDQVESESLLQEGIESLLPGIGSILSFKDELVEEPDSPKLEDLDDVLEDLDDTPESSTLSDESYSQTLEDTSPTGDDSEPLQIEDTDDIDEDIVPEVYNERASEAFHAMEEEEMDFFTEIPEPVLQDEPEVETGIPQMEEPDPVPEDEQESDEPEPASKAQPSKYIPTEDDLDTMSVTPSIDDYSDFTTYLPDVDRTEHVAERQFAGEDSSPLEADDDDGEDLNEEETDEAVYDFIETTSQMYEEEKLPVYEKADITNEADYEIRHQLDELDNILDKEIDDDDDDLDDYRGDESQDEFDFWQF